MDNYRYTLRREWLGSGGVVNFIMLNPSTADDVFDDPTIRKCIGFAKRWGYSGLVVTNLFAFRATDPNDLKTAASNRWLAVGQDNNEHLFWVAGHAAAVVCAWGNHGELLGRDVEVVTLIKGLTLGCIGKTKSGNPLHPCRAPYTSAPEIFKLGTERCEFAEAV